MGTELRYIFAESSLFQLSGLAGLVLFFVLVGIREAREEQAEGYLYLMIALFLAVAHAIVLGNLLDERIEAPWLDNLTVWRWLVYIASPALIVLFVARAIVNFAMYQGRDGLYKLFFGSTLLCFLYMVGQTWPYDVRGILTILWTGLFFKTELAISS